MITSERWLLVESKKEEREEYEKYVSKITDEHIYLANAKLNEIDKKILKLISTLKICTSTQIGKIFFKDKDEKTRITYTSRHIRKLFKLGCIDKFTPFANVGTSPIHVVLAKIGARILDIDEFKPIKVLNQNWRHTIMCSEAFLHIYHKNKIKKWIPELSLDWNNENNKKKLIIDVFALCENNYYAVEIDMGTENMKTLHAKIENYESYFEKNKYRGVIPTVLFYFTNEERAKKLINYINKQDLKLKYQVFKF